MSDCLVGRASGSLSARATCDSVSIGTPHSDTALYLQRPLPYTESMRGLAIAYRADSLAEAEDVIRANSLRPPIA